MTGRVLIMRINYSIFVLTRDETRTVAASAWCRLCSWNSVDFTSKPRFAYAAVISTCSYHLTCFISSPLTRKYIFDNVKQDCNVKYSNVSSSLITILYTSVQTIRVLSIKNIL